MRLDVHQHLYAEPLVDVLATREHPPRIRSLDGRLVLELSGEPASAIAIDDVAARADAVAASAVDRAIVALSSALGVELLPVDEADAVISAYATTAASFPASLGAWGAVPLADPSPARVELLLDTGYVGLCLPSVAVASSRVLELLGPALERLEGRGAPLFVHPGPAVARERDLPHWWPALTDYVDGLQRAWLTWMTAAYGRRAHPGLKVVFAALAGLAPLHADRLAARGGPRLDPDARVFYETSSYGAPAIAAVADRVGARQIVYGSDIPVVEPSAPPESAAENAARLFA